MTALVPLNRRLTMSTSLLDRITSLIYYPCSMSAVRKKKDIYCTASFIFPAASCQSFYHNRAVVRLCHCHYSTILYSFHKLLEVLKTAPLARKAYRRFDSRSLSPIACRNLMQNSRLMEKAHDLLYDTHTRLTAAVFQGQKKGIDFLYFLSLCPFLLRV